MPKIVVFSDGFSSSSAPTISGGNIESYSLLNNNPLSNVVGLIFDYAEAKSIFFDYEIERIGTSTYRQSGVFQAVYNSGWSLSFANYQGDSILDEDLSNDYSLSLSIDSSNGQIKYISNDQIGHVSSKIKLNILKVSI